MHSEVPVFRVRLPVPQKFGSAPPSRRSPSFAAHRASERLRRDENRGVHSSDRRHAAHIRHRGIPGPGVPRPGPREPASRARAFRAHSPPLDLRRAGGVPGGAPRPPLHVGRHRGRHVHRPRVIARGRHATCRARSRGASSRRPSRLGLHRDRGRDPVDRDRGVRPVRRRGPRDRDVGEDLGDGSVGGGARRGAAGGRSGRRRRPAPPAPARRCGPGSGACTSRSRAASAGRRAPGRSTP